MVGFLWWASYGELVVVHLLRWTSCGGSSSGGLLVMGFLSPFSLPDEPEQSQIP